MNQLEEVHAVLRKVSLFQEFSDAELDQFLALLDLRSAKEGERIVKQDDPGESMYILVHGIAHVLHKTGDRTIQLATLESGEFFGELALVDHGPRSADVLAVKDCLLLEIGQASLAAIAGVYPAAAFKFLIAIGRRMVARLRLSNRRYIDTLLAPVDQGE